MATLYLDPTGNGSLGFWFNDYTAIDDGDRAAGGTPGTDSMSVYNEGSEAVITFTIPSSGTPSNYRLYTWNDTGVPVYDLRLSGVLQGSKGNADKDGTDNGWYYYDWAHSTDFASLTEIAVIMAGGPDEDDEVEAIYLEITYTPSGPTFPPWAPFTIMGSSSIIHPPGAGGIK